MRDYALDDDGNLISRTRNVGDSTITEVLTQSVLDSGETVEIWHRANGGVAELTSQIAAEQAEIEITGTLQTIELIRTDPSFRRQVMTDIGCTGAQVDEIAARLTATLPADRRPQVASPKPAALVAAPITPVASAPAPMTIEQIRASLSPEDIAAVDAKLKRVEHARIQASWKQAAARITAEQSGKPKLSSGWEKAIARVSGQQNLRKAQ